MGVGGPPGRPMGPRVAVTQPPQPLMDFGDQTVFSSPEQMQVCILTTVLYLQKGWRHRNLYLRLHEIHASPTLFKIARIPRSLHL